VDHCRVAEPGLAVEGSDVDVCIFLTPAPATDEPDGEHGNDGNTSKSGASISSDGTDAGAIICGGRGRREGRGRATGSLGSARDSELLNGKVSTN